MANKPRFYDKNLNPPTQQNERISRVDDVDRSGYIPLDLQYARMIAAGKTDEQLKDFAYNEDLKNAYEDLANGKLDKKAFETLLSHNMSKVEVDELLKNYKEKARNFKNAKSEYNQLMSDIERADRERDIRQQAVKDYIAMIESSNNNSKS